MNKIKLVKVEDTGTNIVYLSRGEYLIDDKRLTIESYNETELIVEDPYNIRTVRQSVSVSHWANNAGEILSPEDYQEKVHHLQVGSYEDEDDGRVFNDIDAEYAYKKFVRAWKSVFKTEEIISEPIPVSESVVKLDTGNPHISSFFSSGVVKDDKQHLYTYNRQGATKKIVYDCFSSLGMEWVDKTDYHATDGKKIWSNSSHGHLEYVTAFGGYVFNKTTPAATQTGDFRGTLEACQAQYEADKKSLETIIKSKYATHFRNPELKGVELGKAISELQSIVSSVSGLDVKQKSVSSQRSVCTKIRELLSVLREAAITEVN